MIIPLLSNFYGFISPILWLTLCGVAGRAPSWWGIAWAAIWRRGWWVGMEIVVKCLRPTSKASTWKTRKLMRNKSHTEKCKKRTKRYKTTILTKLKNAKQHGKKRKTKHIQYTFVCGICGCPFLFLLFFCFVFFFSVFPFAGNLVTRILKMKKTWGTKTYKKTKTQTENAKKQRKTPNRKRPHRNGCIVFFFWVFLVLVLCSSDCFFSKLGLE